MKNKIVYLIFILIISLTGCSENNSIWDITLSNIEDCNHKPELLITKDDINIYTYCINNVKVNVNDKQKDLKKYIQDNDNYVDRIIETLRVYDVIYDGGTKIYKGNNITLIKCNTLDGNNDIYIGNTDMKHKSNFCKDNNYTFIRTYFVEDIKEYTEQQYTEDGIAVTYGNSFEVKLKNFEGKVDTVLINNLWGDKLKKDKTYEFEFMLYDNVESIEDSVKFIFNNSDIVEIRETNKDINNQINDDLR